MRDSETSRGVRSLMSNLNKIKFGGTNRGGRPMDDNNRMKIWDYVVKNIRDNRNIDRYYGDEQLQKKEFLAWREEIITFFNKELSAWEVKDDTEIERLIRTQGYSYFQDLMSVGIDPRAIFRADLINSNKEADYQSWRSGQRAGWGGISSVGIIEQVKWQVLPHSLWSWPTYRDTDDIRWWVANDGDYRIAA